MTNSYKIGVVVICLLGIASTAQGTDYYVRTSGDDSNSGLAPNTAFLTISKAASVVTAGDIVQVGGGTYLEGVVVEELGTSELPILFIADISGAATGDAGAVIVTPQVDQQFGWSIQNSAYVSLDGFRISGSGMPQANGLSVDHSTAVTIKNAEIDGTIQGLLGVSSVITLQDCTVRDTSTAGLWLNGIDDADLQVSNLTLTDNGTYGLYVDTCSLVFNPANFANWAITGSEVVIAATNSDLTFESVTISGGTTAGVQSSQGNLTANQATFSGNGYGLASDASNVVLTNCTFSGNAVGLYANQDSFLSASDSTFTTNTLWGASVTPSGNMGETATFSGCTFASNAGGLTLINAADGEVLLRNATVIRDNTAAGLHFQNCSLAVNDQAGGANWSTSRNLYGISSNQSRLALSQIVIQDSTSYGVHCQDSTVSLSDCTVMGPYGIHATATNDALTIGSSRFYAGATPHLGVSFLGGRLDVTNTLIEGYWLGVYLNPSGGAKQATLLNVTIANATGYGIFNNKGTALVRNTILTGTGAGYGFLRVAGTMTHSHNLVQGFTTPFYGTTADVTEVQKDPRFVDAANGDYHLGVGSPAINAGMDVGLLVPTDMEGNARPSYNSFEIGAYEYTSPNGSFRVLEWKEAR